MNREIKFKAYDKELKKVLLVDTLQIIDACEGRPGINVFTFSNKMKEVRWLDEGKYELIQYTGLKDKNGKEIYEGDIMYEKYADAGEESGYGETFVEIAFKDGAFGWIGNITNNFYPFAVENIDEYEVIGNIYEHPHLLAGSNAV